MATFETRFVFRGLLAKKKVNNVIKSKYLNNLLQIASKETGGEFSIFCMFPFRE